MHDRHRDDGDAQRSRRWLALIAFALLVALALQLGDREWAGPPPVEVSYTEFKSLVAEGQVAEAVVREHAVYATLVSPYKAGERDATKYVTTRIPSFGETDILAQLEEKNVTVRAEKPREDSFGWLWFLLPWVVILGLYFLFWRRMARATGPARGRAAQNSATSWKKMRRSLPSPGSTSSTERVTGLVISRYPETRSAMR